MKPKSFKRKRPLPKMTSKEFYRQAVQSHPRYGLHQQQPRRLMVSDEHADPGADSDEELQRMLFRQRMADGPPGLVQSEASEAEEGEPGDDEAEEAEEEEEEAPAVPEWRPVAIKQAVFSDADESETSDNPNYCFLCDCTDNRMSVGENTRYKQLREALYDNYGITDVKWLIPKVQTLYNAGVRPYTTLKLPWYKRVIHEHITRHHPTPRAIVEQQLQTFNDMLRALESSGVIEESTIVPGRRRVNTTYASLYKELCKEMRPMINLVTKLRPQKQE
jgi:hypothetical protein